MSDGQEPTATTDAPTGQDPTGTDDPTIQGGESKVFDEAYVRKLRDEAASYRVKLKELEDRDLSEQERVAKERDSLKESNGDLQTRLDRFEVAKDTGLDLELVELLNGSKEQMAAQAAVLIERTKPTVDPTTFDGGVRQTATASDMNQVLRRATGRQ